MANTPYPTKAEAQAWDQQTYREIKQTTEAISAGEGGKSYATLEDAQAVSPKPMDGTVFQVEEQANAGYYKFDSTQTGGTKFLRGFETEEIDYDVLIPKFIFGIDNDSQSDGFFTREYAVKLYPESFLKSKVPVTLNGEREASIQVTEKNTSVKQTFTKNYSLIGEGYTTKSGSYNFIRTKASNAQGKPVRLLCIGDSITASDLFYPDGTKRGGWAFPSMVREIAMKDDVDFGGNTIDVKTLGTRNDQDNRTFDYKGQSYPVRSFSEGQGSRTAANFARHAMHLTGTDSTNTGEACWDMLGLKTSQGRAYSGSNEDRNLIMNTVQKDNWDYTAAVYAAVVGSDTYTGSTAQNDAIDAAMNDILDNPSIPFYDRTKANQAGATTSFSLAKYLERYKTLADDGTTRLTVGVDAGTKVSNTGAYDVCKPTHVVIELGENDRWHYSPTALDIVNSLKLIEAEIRAEFPNMQVAFVNTRLSGSFYPERWADRGVFSEMAVKYNQRKYEIQELLSSEFGTLSSQEAAKRFLLPAYHTMSVNSFSSTREIIDLESLETTLLGNDDINHPGISGSMSIAYQILSWIYYTI